MIAPKVKRSAKLDDLIAELAKVLPPMTHARAAKILERRAARDKKGGAA